MGTGFSDRLKQARKKLNFTQEEVANRIDVHRFTYAKWEQGLHPPGKPSMYRKLAEVLRCQAEWLRDGEGSTNLEDLKPESEINHSRARKGVPSKNQNLSGPQMSSIPWAEIAKCAHLLFQADQSLSVERLERTLPIFVEFTKRAPACCDLEMAISALQHTQ